MSRSTFALGRYKLIGRTAEVRVACGYLLKQIDQNSPPQTSTLEKIQASLNRHVTNDFGFIYITIPELNADELRWLANKISEVINYLSQLGNHLSDSEFDSLLIRAITWRMKCLPIRSMKFPQLISLII